MNNVATLLKSITPEPNDSQKYKKPPPDCPDYPNIRGPAKGMLRMMGTKPAFFLRLYDTATSPDAQLHGAIVPLEFQDYVQSPHEMRMIGNSLSTIPRQILIKAMYKMQEPRFWGTLLVEDMGENMIREMVTEVGGNDPKRAKIILRIAHEYTGEKGVAGISHRILALIKTVMSPRLQWEAAIDIVFKLDKK